MKENDPARPETVFWAALFVGREAILRYRRFFDPRAWFRKG